MKLITSIVQLFVILQLSAATSSAAVSDALRLKTRTREKVPAKSEEWQVVERTADWDPHKTAVIICDMWDQHWCKGATARVAEMAPRMNMVVKEARRRGMFIIHAPSSTMEFYKDTPQRKRAQAAPKAMPKVPLKNWCSLDAAREAALPIDDSDGGCDDVPQCKGGSPWKRQIATIEIADEDAITDSDQAYNLLQERGIENLIVMGVHVNMCVLGRPFSIRQMTYQGKNVVLMRDMTDAMYNSRRKPFVNHFRGSELVVEHIEKFWCPSITSSDLIGGEPFRFADDKRPHVAFIIGENEYHTWETLPEFAAKELEFRGLNCSYVLAPPKGGNDFENYQEIKNADLLAISVRRRAPQKQMMELIRAHVAQGKPVVGIRTASHAFDPRAPVDDRHSEWTTFDSDVLGGDYQGHYSNKPPNDPVTYVRVVASAAAHPILTGISAEPFVVTSHLYKNPNPKPTITPLMVGWLDGRAEVHPVAWVNTANNRRVFYTSLGSPDDFANATFRRLLLNGILWAVGQPVPPAEMTLSAAPALKSATN
jgi:type 1 glutamine amidotransferase/nicotinamidase-related amidase